MELPDFSQNQFLFGLIGAMASGWMMWLLREVPKKILTLVTHQLMVELSVNSEEDIFHWCDEWLSRQDYNKRSRRLQLKMSRVSTEDWLLTPGWGTHLLWFRGRPLLIERSNKEPTVAQTQLLRNSSTITIKTLGRHQETIRALIAAICDERFKREKLDIYIHQRGWWERLSARPKRDLATVFLPTTTRDAIVDDARRFFGRADWYSKTGVPYRRGWMFSGGPGAGKTSMVAAIASLFDRPIYYLNLATLEDDNALMNAFSTADRKSILLLEDVDAIQITRQRAPKPARRTNSNKADDTPGRRGVTLSGLLNAIDGVASADGRLLIMTSNHPEALDAALVRPGRVDRVFNFGTMVPECARAMALAFFPGNTTLATAVAAAAPQSPAYWQGLFMTHQDEPAKCLAVLLDRSTKEPRRVS